MFPSWQVAVETAQVVGGLVQYPHDNPFYIYRVKLWTFLHQVIAVLLRSGVSEQTASFWISGLLGMVAFQAIATLILALSGDWRLSLGGSIAVFFARPNEFGGICIAPRFVLVILASCPIGGCWPGARLFFSSSGAICLRTRC